MFKFGHRRQYSLTSIIVFSLLINGLMCPIVSATDRKPIVISFGQPNIWSLEQAHYLLARMHMANLDLQAKTLSTDDLDPNVTHGTRIEIIKQLLEVSGQFDQGIGFQNNRIVEQSRFNDTRRRELTSNRDRLRANSVDLQVSIHDLERQRALIADANSEKAKELDAQLKQKRDDQATIDKEITFQDSEIGKLGAEPAGTLASPTPSGSPFDKTRLPDSILSKLSEDELKKLLGSGRDPKLNATTKLDNTVQLQYEIIAKQLTLLRDEVGPGERLVFLELPQSIYTAPGSGDEKMAQTWWHVSGYTRVDPLVRLLIDLYEIEWKWQKIRTVPAFKTVANSLKDSSCPANTRAIEKELRGNDLQFGLMFQEFKCERNTAREKVLRDIFRTASSDFSRAAQGGARDNSKLVDAIRKVISTTTKGAVEQRRTIDAQETKEDQTNEAVRKVRDELLDLLSKADDEITIDVTKNPKYTTEQGMEFMTLDEETPSEAGNKIARRTVRAVDIIPRQSSLNVNDVQETVKATGILAGFKFLFGFAGQVNFQRQREQFEQFLHQELYASGFGKGNRDFGWTFGALPGTKRVAPGVRTTYAALVVPDDAESLVLSARGCYFPRKSYQPLDFEDTRDDDWKTPSKFPKYNCSEKEQTYILPIPGGGNTSNFWVTNVNYQPVAKGDMVTVSVRGNNFSSQMGVLVNGVPLSTTVGLAQPNLMPKPSGSPNGGSSSPLPGDCASSPGTENTTVCGRYERIDPQQIIFSFKLPANSNIGIPTITLVAPGKAVDLNSLPNLWVNGALLGENQRLTEDSKPAFMFGKRPSSVLSVNDLIVLNASPGGGDIDALLSGTDFKSSDEVYVNGLSLRTAGAMQTFKSANLIQLHFPIPADDNVKISVVRNDEVVSKSFPNPAALKITAASVVSYDAPAPNKPGLLVVHLDGTGFSPRLAPPTGSLSTKLTYVSPTEVIIKITGPQNPVVIQLRDPLTTASASWILQRLP